MIIAKELTREKFKLKLNLFKDEEDEEDEEKRDTIQVQDILMLDRISI